MGNLKKKAVRKVDSKLQTDHKSKGIYLRKPVLFNPCQPATSVCQANQKWDEEIHWHTKSS